MIIFYPTFDAFTFHGLMIVGAGSTITTPGNLHRPCLPMYGGRAGSQIGQGDLCDRLSHMVAVWITHVSGRFFSSIALFFKSEIGYAIHVSIQYRYQLIVPKTDHARIPTRRRGHMYLCFSNVDERTRRSCSNSVHFG